MISDRVSSLFFLCISIIYLVFSLQMPIGQLSQPGPGLMPFSLGVIMVLVSLGNLLRCLNLPKLNAFESINREAYVRISLLIVGLILYCVLLPLLGFFFVTFFFEIAYMKLFGVTRWRTMISVAIAVTLVTFFFFDIYLQIPFPRGIWWEWWKY